MWVIFEGLDKSGKGTLEREFLKSTNFEHIIVDRGPVGYLTFDKIFGRNTEARTNNFIKQARKAMKSNDFMVVYCKADKQVVEQRLELHNETCPYDYVKAQKIYRNNIRRFYNEDKILELDTSNRSVDECVELIVKKLQEVLRNERKL